MAAEEDAVIHLSRANGAQETGSRWTLAVPTSTAPL